ncbi:histone H1 [Diachasma alloeum]|uniref:histone H1 n=1 Tax=Diachasma alloeum TaxID=454923 RepID=UPI0007382FC7|nr:histone H1 [Diachasma alloeum]
MMIKTEEVDATPEESVSEEIEKTEQNDTIEKPSKATQPRPKPNYPRVSEMVNLAIKALCEKNGSSLQAIKKYMVETYKIDVEKQNPFIKKYLKSAVEAGFLIRTKGRGAAGSFKIPRHEIDPLKAVVKPKAKARRATAAKTATKGKKTKASAGKGTSPRKVGGKSGGKEKAGEGSAQPKGAAKGEKTAGEAKPPRGKRGSAPRAQNK